VVVWYWTNHRDRYLQACFPWLALVTTAVLLRLWESAGALGRVAAGLLVTTQLAVGAGTWLWPLHVMVKERHALLPVIELVKAGHEGRFAERFEPFEEWNFADWTALGKRLPKGARVLVHEDRLWLGLDAPVVVDEAQWQAGIRYLDLATPAAVHDELTRYRVTHVVTGHAHGDGGGHGVSGDLFFLDFVARHARKVSTSGKLTLYELPPSRPPGTPLGPSLVLTCNQSLAPGLYDSSRILRGQPEVAVSLAGPLPPGVLERAQYVIVEKAKGCENPLSADDLAGFESIGVRRTVAFYARKR
jgi:hypothetical protein